MAPGQITNDPAAIQPQSTTVSKLQESDEAQDNNVQNPTDFVPQFPD
jgi:hypothetical protein